MRFHGALVLCGLCIATPNAARAQDAKLIEGGYEITFAGFSGFRIDFTARIDGNRYDVDSHTYKVGVLKALTLHYEGLNRAWGAITPQGDQPAGGSLSIVVSGTRRTWLAQYGPEGLQQESHSPAWNPSPQDAIPEDKKRASLDPLTAAIAVSLAGDRGCDHPAPSNDGKRRVDIVLHKVGMERAASTAIPGAKGNVLICDLYTKRVAGQFDEPQNEAETEKERPMRLWLAQFDDSPIRYPGRLEAHTGFGTIRGRMLFFRERPLTEQDKAAAQK